LYWARWQIYFLLHLSEYYAYVNLLSLSLYMADPSYLYKYLIVLPPLFMGVWMALAFSIHLLARPQKTKELDNVLFELKRPRILYLLSLVVLSVCILGCYYFALNNASLPERFQFKNMEGLVKVIGLFLFVLGHFLVLVVLRLLWLNPSYFMITQDGFLYEPGSISPGLILWDDIEEINEREMLSKRRMNGWSPTRTFLIITLKDPAKYYSRYNIFLRAIVVLLAKLTKLQTNKVGDIVLQPSDFGSSYEEVRELIMENRKAHLLSL